MSSAFARIMRYAVTLFLFTKSDIQTTLIPLSFSAMAMAPAPDLFRLGHVTLWLWLHLLQFNVSNQTVSADEDAINKKSRPIPSNRITLHHAITLRYATVPPCLLLSAIYGVDTVYASVMVCVLTFAYNEMHGHGRHWILRNALNAIGLGSFQWGSTLIAGSSRPALDRTSITALLISMCMLATTIHAQDFRDVDGDRAIKRSTIPICFPSFARWTILIPLLVWSFGLVFIWQLDSVTSSVLIGIALYVGGRYLQMKTAAEDQISYRWYGVWNLIAIALPGYYRYRYL